MKILNTSASTKTGTYLTINDLCTWINATELHVHAALDAKFKDIL